MSENAANGLPPEGLMELHEVLNDPEARVEGLYTRAISLLERDGSDQPVNGVPHTVTNAYSVYPQGETSFYARLARRTEAPNEDPDPRLKIVFDTHEDPVVTTPAPSSLYFGVLGGKPQLVMETSDDPRINDPEYINLAEKIVTEIEQKVAARERQIIITSPEKVRHPKRTAAAWLGLLLTAYSHLPFGHVNAEIGALPMPLPVEALVDWNNASDHAAQGYPVPPDSAVTVFSNNEHIAIPVVSEAEYPHDVDSAPDTTYVVDEHAYNEVKPGLYTMELPEQDTVSSAVTDMTEDNLEWPFFDWSEQCYPVKANLVGGRTVVFTRDPAIADIFELRARTTRRIDVCLQEGRSLTEVPQGSIQFYERTDEQLEEVQ